MNAATSIPLEHSEEGRAFLQHRVGRFGLYASCLGWFFLVFRSVGSLLVGAYRDFVDPSFLLHALAALSLTAIWGACRGKARTVPFLRTVETVGLLLACGFYTGMGMYLPVSVMPHYIVILALGLGLIARAIYVPSSGGRTLLITSLAGIPLLVSTYVMYARMDVEPWREVIPGGQELTADYIAGTTTGFSAAWWLCIVLLCFGASRVIYGLRREVRAVKKLGQYSLVEKLGEGGMGVVYRASHAMLRRPTAIKLLPAAKAGEEYLRRFEKEVQLTAQLTHPNTVTIFDYGRTPEGVFYYAMEFLDGATLADVVAMDGPQSPARVVHILRQAAGALAEAHAVRLIHRDIKPANIMLVSQGGSPDVVKMLDFGLVKDLDAADDAVQTLEGAITGTPQYMPPEAIRAPDRVDARGDLYALGAVGYFLLTGAHVFDAETVVEVCTMHLHDEPVPPAVRLGSPVPPDLEAILLDCLAKDPADRPLSARSLRERLDACAEVGAWSEEEARAWWSRYDPVLATRRRAEPVTGQDVTLAIAMEDRGDEPSSAPRGPL